MINMGELFKKTFSKDEFLKMAKNPVYANTVGKYVGFSSGYISYIKAKSGQRTKCFQNSIVEEQARFIEGYRKFQKNRLKELKKN